MSLSWLVAFNHVLSPMSYFNEHLLGDIGRIEELFDDNFIASLQAGVDTQATASTAAATFEVNESSSGSTAASSTHQTPPTHTQKKQFRCHTCNKTFSTQWNLDRHTTQHTGDKEYRCGECGKEFALKDKYQQHLRRHDASARQYKCTVCDKELADRSSLKQHLETHNKSRQRYKCPVCSLSYTKPRIVRTHIHKAHLGGVDGVNVGDIPLDESAYAYMQLMQPSLPSIPS